VLSIPDLPVRRLLDGGTTDRPKPEAPRTCSTSSSSTAKRVPRRPIPSEYDAYTKMLRDRGAFVAGDALWPTSSATTVRIRDGRTVMTDGPFAETKEALGGYYQVEAKDLDEALEIAAACPGARWGSVEVRPIVDFAAGQTPG
jgi:hypothetical protein